MKIKTYDTTLRDGSQQEGISFSISDKLKIAQKLIDFNISFIEGGFAGSNLKDDEFFKKAKKLDWKKSHLTAFCSTRHKKNKAKDDTFLNAALKAGTQYITVFGKTWKLHSEKILNISEEENLDIIFSSIKYLTDHGKKVFFDAEHFFDGFKDDSDFALKCLKAASQAGAFNLSLCDTNGGSLAWETEEITKKVKKEFPKLSVGIHAHNDCGMAEANSLSAVKANADLIQGTINGFGERTGNANLCVLIPNLSLKMKKEFSPKINVKKLFSLSNFVSEISNSNPPNKAPFVGLKAFTHKAGVHVSAVEKIPESYEHINPELVGNQRHTTVSELAGRTNITVLAKNLGLHLEKNSEKTKNILQAIKKLEAYGFAFEGAEASFELLIKRSDKKYKPAFQLVDFLVFNRQSREKVEAEVQVKIKDKIYTGIDLGNGPVNALDKAMRKCLLKSFPQLKKVKLTDYKVRIIDSKSATGAKTRVLIESSDGKKNWTTVGCHHNITKASMQALIDAFEYAM